ncbi:MAG: DUF6212 domain-containing protein [Kordiimonas sp.]
MPQLTLTSKAAAKIYAATCSLIVDSRVMKKIRGELPDCVSVFLLQSNGVVSCASKKDSHEEGSVPFIGLPIGLLGIVGTAASRELVSNFLDFAASQNPKYMPEVIEVSGLPLIGKKKIGVFLNKLLSRELVSARGSLSVAERQLVSLRDKNEQLSLGFEKAQRMIVGAGYSTRTICFDLHPGTETVGPDADAVTYGFSQVLPIDLASFTGVAVYVAEEATADNGSVSLIVRRRSDHAIIGVSEVPYVSFKQGWHNFIVADVAGRTFGDGILQIEWRGASGPKFALADETADRFGTDDSKTLALRLERGLVAPPSVTDSPSFEANTVRTKLSAATIAERGRFFGGHEAESARTLVLGSDVLKHDPSGRWVQTHVLKDSIAAVQLAGCLTAGLTEVSAMVGLAHRKAAPCIALLVAAPAGQINEAALSELYAQHVHSKLAAAGKESGLQWSSKVLVPGSDGSVNLCFDDQLEADHDLLLCVMPVVEGKNDRGWCRWQQVTLTRHIPSTQEVVGFSAEQLQQATKHNTQIRVHRFPELADHLPYYQGKQAHIALREKLGFWPVEFSDDTGAMQLHPLSNGNCAAILASGLPENTKRIACEVGTAHGQADDFIYVLGVVPSGEQSNAVIDRVANKVRQGEMIGSDETGTEWSSLSLSALQKRTLELIPAESNGQKREVFFITLPVTEGKTSYGWCRWYLLSFEMAPHVTSIRVLDTDFKEIAAGE